MKKILLIVLCIIPAILLSGCVSPYTISIKDFNCEYYGYSELEICKELSQQYMIYDTMKGYNFSEIMNEIDRLDI